MIEEEKFQYKYNSQKVANWQNNYIDYFLLKQELDTIIEKNKKNIKEQIKENKEIKEIIPEYETARRSLTNESLPIEEECMLPPNHDDKKEKNEEKNIQEVSFNKISKDFINLLDKELKKFYEFYKNKEKNLYDNMNIQISNFMDSNKNKNNDKKIEIISELIYLSNLCKELLNYVYVNITAIMRILCKFDNMFTNISYNYIKKYLSKDNGYLTYILNFHILDKSLVSIKDIFNSIKESFEKDNFFKNNKNYENKFNENEKTILENINISNDLHEKIYLEFNSWEKYLNISLDLPNSNHNSIFINTSFIGDSILSSEDEIKRKTIKNIKFIDDNSISNNNDQIIDEDNIENNLNINDEHLDDIIRKQKFKEEQLIVDFGVLFEPLDTFSYRTNKVLSKENNNNLKIIVLLVGFYAYSYILLVPDMIRYLDLDSESNLNNEAYYLYGIVISIPLLGNIIAKIFYESCLYKISFKKILYFSLSFIVIYYVLSYLGIIFNNTIEYKIIYIIIGRFFLGLSYLKQLTKVYIDNYIPITNQVRTNEKYALSIYLGNIIGLFINFLYYFNWNNQQKENNDSFKSYLFCISIIIGLSLNYNLIMIVNVISQFQLKDKLEFVNQNIINNKNEEDKNIKNIQKIEEIQEIKEDEDDILPKIKDDNEELNNEHLLSEYINKNKSKKKKYYRIIFIILLFVLLTSQYISENLLLLLPRLLTYNVYQENHNYNLIIFPIFSSLSYLISYFLQRLYLKNSYMQKIRKILLILISMVMIIFSSIFIYLCINDPDLFFLNNENNINYFIIFAFFALIIFNELYHIISVNYFIILLPTQNLKFGPFKASTLINYITKIGRFIPSLILLGCYFTNKETKLKTILIGEYYFNGINICNTLIFGIQILLLLINIIFFLFFSSYMKSGPINRILNES